LAILIPVAVFLVLWRAFRHLGDSTREALLRAAVLSASLLIAITEILSIPYLLTKAGLAAAWSLAFLGALGFLISTLKTRPAPKQAGSGTTVHLPAHLSLLDVLLAAAIAAILAIIGLIAIVVPPNSWDVMEHHMPRVLFWVSNHSLRVFPTPDYTQVVQGTAAESITLNTYLLWGSDRFANMPEFLSLCGSVVAASLIAARFGAHRTGQLTAALFLVTLPEALLESSGSMSTGIASFWIATACFFLIRAGAASRNADVLTAALAAGLALLTKGITAVYLPALVLGCVLFRPTAVRLWFLKRLPVFLVLVVGINAGQFVRAWQVTGTPFDEPFPAGGPRVAFANGHISPAAIAANVLRQTSLQLGTPSGRLNRRIEATIRKAITLLGEDPDDPRSSWSSFPFYVDHPARLETQAGNPVHFALIIACFFLAPFLKLRLKDRRLIWYIASIVLGFIVFSASIRWQPWGSRFHLPLFVMAAAIVGVAAERVFKTDRGFTRRWLILFPAALLVAVALPYLLSNSTRSVLRTKDFPTIFDDRAALYFADQHTAQAPVVLAMADAIRKSGCGRIALDAYLPIPEPRIGMSPPSFYIYPLLAQLGIDGKTNFVRYIHVQNPTAAFAPRTPSPPDCAVVCLSCRLSRRNKSDAAMGETRLFGNDELVFPLTRK
jgi:hypothetical protein